MKKAAKIIALVLGVLVFAIIALIIALPLLIDPNDYKPQLVRMVKDQTGRELRIDGDIGLSFFPWLGLEFNQVTLSNAPGFGPEPFARVETAGLKVKLLPLLRRKVMVDRVILAGLNVNLARDQRGRTNWDDLLAQPAKPAPEPAKPAEGPGLAAFEVAGVDVERAQATWRDGTTGASYTLRDLALTTGALRSATPTPIRLEFDLTSGSPPLRTRVALRSRAALDVAKQTLNVSNLVLEMAGLTLKGELRGEKIFDAPAFAGQVDVPTFDPRALLAKLGIDVATRDPKALAGAALNARFQASARDVRLSNLTATLDQSKLTGHLELPRLAPPAYRFDLKLDQFDLDRYLPPPGADTEGTRPEPAKAAAGARAQQADAFAPLRGLDAQGSFRVGNFKAFGLKTRDTLITLTAKDDNIAINPIQTKLYGGGLQGNANLNLRGDRPSIALDQALKGVQLEPLLRDADLFKKFSGIADVDLKLAMQGTSAAQWTRSLTGNANVAIQNGALQGVDLARMVNEIETIVRERRLEAATSLIPRADERTPFNALRMSAQVKDGVATSDNLDIQAAGLRVAGRGSANLPAENLDYLLLVNDFPIKVSGPFARLKFKPDWNAIVKGKAEKRLEQEKQKLKEREGELGKELQEKLDKRLKELFKK